MNVFTINGIDYLHIQDFADIIGRSKQSTRRLIEDGNSARRLKAMRDRSRLMVPVIELVGYPFVNQGKQLTGQDIYHYHAYDAETGMQMPAEQAIKICDDMQKRDENWHDRIIWQRELCTECTYTKGCISRIVADGLEVPRGDK